MKSNSIIYLSTGEKIVTDEDHNYLNSHMLGPNRLVNIRRITGHGSIKNLTILSGLITQIEDS